VLDGALELLLVLLEVAGLELLLPDAVAPELGEALAAAGVEFEDVVLVLEALLLEAPAVLLALFKVEELALLLPDAVAPELGEPVPFAAVAFEALAAAGVEFEDVVLVLEALLLEAPAVLLALFEVEALALLLPDAVAPELEEPVPFAVVAFEALAAAGVEFEDVVLALEAPAVLLALFEVEALALLLPDGLAPELSEAVPFPAVAFDALAEAGVEFVEFALLLEATALLLALFVLDVFVLVLFDSLEPVEFVLLLTALVLPVDEEFPVLAALAPAVAVLAVGGVPVLPPKPSLLASPAAVDSVVLCASPQLVDNLLATCTDSSSASIAALS
jgi:hypothetical protein